MKDFDKKLDATRDLIQGLGITTGLSQDQKRKLFPLTFTHHKDLGDLNPRKIKLSFREFQELAQYVYAEMGVSEGQWMRDFYTEDLAKQIKNKSINDATKRYIERNSIEKVH